MRKPFGILVALILCLRIAPVTQAEDVMVFGVKYRGKARPAAIVKVKDLEGDDEDVGVITNLDTGSPFLVLQEDTAQALNLDNEDPITVMVGDSGTLKARTFQEDTVAKNRDLQNKDQMKSIMVKVGEPFGFDALGSDTLINGLVAFFDPMAAGSKTFRKGGVKFMSGGLRFFPALKDGKTNPEIVDAFNPPVKLPVKLTPYGGFKERPTVISDLKSDDAEVKGKKAIWDTGATYSKIGKDLAMELGLEGEVGDQVIIPEVTFAGKNPMTGETDTFKIWELKAVVQDRPAEVPLLIGMNVLEQFKLLIDLHKDPAGDGTDVFFGLELKKPTFSGNVKGGKVIEIAPDGSEIQITWTQLGGKPLLGDDGQVVESSGTVPVRGASIGRLEFPAPEGAQDFEQRVTVPQSPLGPTSSLMVEAFEVVPSVLESSVDGDLLGPEVVEVGSIWDTLVALIGPGVEGKLPDLYADTDLDGELDADDVLYSAVDLSAVSADFLNTSFLHQEFVITDGEAAGLPGFVFGTAPIEVNFLATPGGPRFINPEPFTGMSEALSEHRLEANPGATWDFYGYANGGLVSATILGFTRTCTVSVETRAGQSAAEVASEISAAMSLDTCLAEEGIVAVAQGARVLLGGGGVTEDSVTTVIEDSGLTHQVSVPALPPWGMLVLTIFLAVAIARTVLARAPGPPRQPNE